MTQPTPATTDASGGEALPCLKCHYNLTGLSPTSICPECQCPIADSALAARGLLSPLARLQALRGVTVLVVAHLLVAIHSLILIIAKLNQAAWAFSPIVDTTLQVFGLLWLLGVYSLAHPWPRLDQTPQPAAQFTKPQLFAKSSTRFSLIRMWIVIHTSASILLWINDRIAGDPYADYWTAYTRQPPTLTFLDWVPFGLHYICFISFLGLLFMVCSRLLKLARTIQAPYTTFSFHIVRWIMIPAFFTFTLLYELYQSRIVDWAFLALVPGFEIVTLCESSLMLIGTYLLMTRLALTTPRPAISHAPQPPELAHNKAP